MHKIMAKMEQEMADFIRKKMLLLEKEHKKIFTKEEHGLVSIPDFLGYLTWPDHHTTMFRTSLYRQGTEIVYIFFQRLWLVWTALPRAWCDCSGAGKAFAEKCAERCEALHQCHCDIKCSIDDERFIDIRESPVTSSDEDVPQNDDEIFDTIHEGGGKRSKVVWTRFRYDMLYFMFFLDVGMTYITSSFGVESIWFNIHIYCFRYKWEMHSRRCHAKDQGSCQSASGGSCSMCCLAIEKISWHPDVPYICFSVLSKAQKHTLVQHDKLHARELRMEMSGSCLQGKGDENLVPGIRYWRWL